MRPSCKAHPNLPSARSRFAATLLFSAMAVAAAASLGREGQASAILFDNLSAGSPNGYISVSNTQWMAQGFSTTAAGFILSEVSLRLYNQSGTTGSFEIQVWDSTGASGAPGVQVGSAIYTGLAQSLSSSSGSLLNIPGLSVALDANTNYYLVARGTSLTDLGTSPFTFPGSVGWEATDVQNTSEYSTINGTTWNGPSSTNLYMSVTAVPEPTAITLLAGGGLTAGLLGYGRRRRQRK